MLGLMQQRPLLISSLIDYAATWHGDRQIVSRDPEGRFHRSDYSQVAARAKRVAAHSTGSGSDTAIASRRWRGTAIGISRPIMASPVPAACCTPSTRDCFLNSFSTSCIMPRTGLSSSIRSLRPWSRCWRRSSRWCAAGWRCATLGQMPKLAVKNLLCYEELVAAASADYDWPQLDENAASTLCYTSGTTGNPKGVLYSHRSTILHAFAACSADALALSARDSILVVVPLFHANAWSLPFSAAMCGAKLVLPGPKLDPESIYMLLEQEECTKAGGIPTIWLNFLAWLENNRANLDLSRLKLKLVFSGGTAAPRATIEKFHDLLGVFLLHAWGMTETSPLVTTGTPLPKHEGTARERVVDMQVKQGRQVYGVELKVVGRDGRDLPHDGKSVGELKVRGNWVISGYFKGEGGMVVDADGWFGTGDVATIDGDGYVQLTDRLKDVIKSGGEWISSIEIENLVVSHPEVFEAAVIAISHPVWQERPLLLVQPKPGCRPSKQSILDFLSDKIAKWWMPDDVVFVESLPHTATGKLLKTELRAQYHGHLAVSG